MHQAGSQLLLKGSSTSFYPTFQWSITSSDSEAWNSENGLFFPSDQRWWLGKRNCLESQQWEGWTKVFPKTKVQVSQVLRSVCNQKPICSFFATSILLLPEMADYQSHRSGIYACTSQISRLAQPHSHHSNSTSSRVQRKGRQYESQTDRFKSRFKLLLTKVWLGANCFSASWSYPNGYYTGRTLSVKTGIPLKWLSQRRVSEKRKKEKKQWFFTEWIPEAARHHPWSGRYTNTSGLGTSRWHTFEYCSSPRGRWRSHHGSQVGRWWSIRKIPPNCDWGRWRIQESSVLW